MKAWQYTNTGSPLALNDVDDPVPGRGEVLIAVRSCGLCHTDVGALDDPGWRPLFTAVPRTMGHEIAGTIQALGTGVTGYSVGERVAMLPLGRPGFARDGGFAPLTTASAEHLVRIPDGVSFEQASAASDAGMTSHHAVAVVAAAQPGMKIGIIGIGGLGEIGARVAMLLGAEVYAAEINESSWPLAEAAGVTSIARSITDFKSVGLDAIVDFAGFGTTTDEAIATVRPGGRVVLVGMGRLTADINTLSLIIEKKRLVGSAGGTKEDVEAVLDHIAAGRLTPTLTTIGFDQIPEGIDRLRAGQVRGRLVAQISGASDS